MTTPTIQSQLVLMNSSDGMVDMYVLDNTKNGGTIHYFSNQCYENGTALVWGGNTYVQIPIGLDSLELKAANSDLPQPTLSVGNIGAGAVSALGDLTGATLTHYKTKVSYLDGQPNADTTKYVGPYVWIFFQKTLQTNQQIQYKMSSIIDRPGYMYPVRQVLKTPGINQPDGIYFPGVSAYRFNPSQSQ